MPEITRQDRKAAVEIWNGDYAFDKKKFIDAISNIIARHTRDGELREALADAENKLTLIVRLAQDIALVDDFNLNKAQKIARDIYNAAYPGKARALLAALDAEEKTDVEANDGAPGA